MPVRESLPARVGLFKVYGVHHSAARRVDGPEQWEVTRTTTQGVDTATVWEFEVEDRLRDGWHRTLAEAAADARTRYGL
jgi:hypothetical protein